MLQRQFQGSPIAQVALSQLSHTDGIVSVVCLLPASEAASVPADCHAFVFVRLLLCLKVDTATESCIKSDL